MISKAKILRELFRSKSPVRIVGAHDGLGAKLIEKNRFDGVWASGLEISAAHALPDANILTMSDFFHSACVMNDATLLPVVCDCDTGFGNALNVIQMVKKYESAGLAAVVIEDKIFPKVNSFIPGRQDLAPIGEFMGKIEAAKSVQKNPDFMVFARVEALIAGWGMDEALRRAAAYAEAGADGIVIHSKGSTPDEVFTFAQRWRSGIPLIAIPTTYYDVPAQEFAERGFRMVIYANQGLRASIKAMDTTFRKIYETGSTAAVENSIAPMKEVFHIQGMHDLKERENKFEKKEKIQAVIPAAGDPRLQPELGGLLDDRPLCMLEIGGKTLIDREADILRSCGVGEIFVIGGFHGEKIRADGTKILHNEDYRTTGNVRSLLVAAPFIKNKCLMAYSDIIFDRQIVERLTESPHAITLVMDRAYRAIPRREKKLDLVVSRNAADGERKLELDIFKPIEKIGQKIPKNEANGEFIGMAFLSRRGFEILIECRQKALAEFKSGAFYESPDVSKADINDLLQYVIDLGHPVYGLEIERGWSEIHSLKDFERVKAHFTRSDTVLSARP